MSDIKVASRYAKALLELAIEKDQLEEVIADVQLLLSIASGNRDFVLMLSSPIVNTDKKFKVLEKLFASSANNITMSFFGIVTRKNRSNVLVSTGREFQKQYNLYKGIQVAEITTTVALDDELRNAVVEIVKEISGLDKVELVEKIDSEIIGGFILKVNDKLLDDSISSKLRDLRLKFAQRYFVKLF
ncbi:ATP synthase F1 subunit delta [Mongoliibacter ruber]|uniref:ATP synthase subunit delta n=1 Tax=Mongoliibacter ruber TaxID=1750599 RepID=A0A2T0WR76_9BACT|nr:ATP synthase F1 subunit delta [Mongoliibacter ruber]PRY89213.1 F-type H+-transporting ATPase subunit delta [Mongoliibacter ruber]